MRFLKKLIFFVMIIETCAVAKEIAVGKCISFYEIKSGLVNGYPKNMRYLTRHSKHTMMDMDNYLLANLGQQTLNKISNNESFYIIEGDGHTHLKELESMGWSVSYRLEKASGFHEILEIRKGGEKKNIVLRVNGSDRLVHVLSLFKMAGLPNENVFSKGGRRDWSPEYRDTFGRVGDVPDLVIYGLSYQSVEALLKLPSKVSSFKAGDMLRGVPTDLNSPDINGRPLLTIELESGYKIWVIPVLYGDLTFDILNAVMDHGAKKILYLGSAGGINSRLKVGDWIQPNRNLISAIPEVGQHVHSPSVHLQTETWYKNALKNGDDFVDMELQSAQMAAAKHSDVDFKAALAITDLVGPREKNFYMVRTGEVPGISEKVQETIIETVPQLANDPIKTFKKIPFISQIRPQAE